MFAIIFLLILNLLFFKSKNKVLLYGNFLILLVFAGYRELSVGTDTINYSHHFDLVSSGEVLSHELLWYVLNKIIYIGGGTFQTVLIVSSILTLLPICYVSYKKSPYPLLSIFFYIALYYYFYSFNIIRQCIAMSFCLLSFYFIDERKNLKAYLVFLFAILFHFSSVVILPALILLRRNIQIKKNTSYLILLAAFFIGLFFGKELTKLIQKFLYSGYSIDSEFNLLGTSVLLLLLNGTYFFLASIVKDENKWFTLFFIFILISNLTVRIPFANRFVFFYGITLIIFYPQVINNNKLGLKYKMVLLLLLVCYALLSLYTLWGRGEILPYENVLF